MARKPSNAVEATEAPETAEVEESEVDAEGRPLKTPQGGDIVYL